MNDYARILKTHNIALTCAIGHNYAGVSYFKPLTPHGWCEGWDECSNWREGVWTADDWRTVDYVMSVYDDEIMKRANAENLDALTNTYAEGKKEIFEVEHNGLSCSVYIEWSPVAY